MGLAAESRHGKKMKEPPRRGQEVVALLGLQPPQNLKQRRRSPDRFPNGAYAEQPKDPRNNFSRQEEEEA